MAQLTGTLLISSLTTNNSEDTFPVFLTEETKGGYIKANTLQELKDTQSFKLVKGMLGIVLNELDEQLNDIYVLQPNLITWKYLNSKYSFFNKLDTVFNFYNFNILLSSPYRFKIISISFKTEVGSCNLTFYTGVLPTEGFSNLIATSNIATINSSVNIINLNKGSNLHLVLSNCSIDLKGLSLQVNLERDFADSFNTTQYIVDSEFRYYNSTFTHTTYSDLRFTSLEFIPNYNQLNLDFYLTQSITILNV